MPSCDVKDSRFDRPLPWIGLFIAVASLLLSITMSLDAFVNFRHRTYWFLCKFFSLNFASSTLLSVAVILLDDLNAYMPRPQDQLVKLSIAVLTSVSMANFKPSLEALEAFQVGLGAVGTIVISVLLNVFVQTKTGTIHAFLFEHATMVIFISLVFLFMCFSALLLATAKRFLEQQYHLKIQQVFDFHEAEDLFSVEKPKVFVRRHWTTANECNPQYFVTCSATCSASVDLCAMGSLVFIQALLRSTLWKSLNFSDGLSDYKWQSTLVLVSHTVAFLVGAIAPAFRSLHNISLMRRLSYIGRRSELRNKLNVERYWAQRLEAWKERPLHFPLRRPRARKLAIGL